MKIYLVIKAALQQYGEFTLVKTEKAYTDRARADEFAKTQPLTWGETIDGINFVCERAVHEVELET